MEMVIHLDNDIFQIVKNGTKKIEVRVNDEKRRKLKVGDNLIFLERPDEIKKIKAIVTKLEYYDNFNELVKYYDIKDMYLEEYTKEEFLKLLERFYSKEEQNQFGVVAISFLKYEKSCGCVVFKDNEVLLVHHNSGHWGFPKGHIEDSETEEETAIRETKEETNIDVKITQDFKKIITYSPNASTTKDVVFFIGSPLNDSLVPQNSEVQEVRYVLVDDAINLITHEDEKNVLKEAIKCYRKNYE